MGKTTKASSTWAAIEAVLPGGEQQAYEQEQAYLLSVAHRVGELYAALKHDGVPSRVAGRIVENYCLMLFMPDEDAGEGGGCVTSRVVGGVVNSLSSTDAAAVIGGER